MSLVFNSVFIDPNNFKFGTETHCTGCPKKVLYLINFGTKALCLTSEMLFALDQGDPNLDSDILFFSFG